LHKLGKMSYALVNDQDDSMHDGFGSNQGFVVLEDSVLIFDTGFTTRHAIVLERAIKHVTEKKPRYVINSHDHSDHVFGNSFFSKKYSKSGISIISHKTCQSQLQKLGQSRLERYRKADKKLSNLLADVQVCLPEIAYSDFGIRLNVEGTDLLLIHPQNGAHTLGDTVLALPDERVMFLGDILFNEFFPNLEDANLESWIDFLRDIDLGTYRYFVPGHGAICGPNEVVRFRQYLITLRERFLSEEANIESQNPLSIFETDETRNWKFRHILQRNFDVLLFKRTSHRLKSLK
jgi:cyclase